MNQAEQAAWRDRFRLKFGAMRVKYPHFNLGSYDESEALDIQYERYIRCLRQLKNQHNLKTWRLYLVAFWVAIEFFVCKIVQLDLSGFAYNQLLEYQTYEEIMMEMQDVGIGIGEDWHPLTKLLMMTLLQAVVFIIIKLASTHLGPAIGGLLKTGINGAIQSANEVPATIREMENVGGVPGAAPAAPGATTGAPTAPATGGGLGGLAGLASGLDLGALAATFAAQFSAPAATPTPAQQQQATSRRRAGPVFTG